MAIAGTCAPLPTPQRWQASLIILPSLEEPPKVFSQESGQGATSDLMDLASEMNQFSMPGLEHILEG